MLSSVAINNGLYFALPSNVSKVSNGLSFKGLTRDMKKQIYGTADIMQKIYCANKGTVAGKPPSDIVKAIIDISDSKIEVGQNIADFMNSVNEAVFELKQYEELSLKSIFNFDLQAYLNEEIKKSEGNLDMAKVLEKISSCVSDEETEVIEKCAAYPMEKALKNSGILPEGGKVLVKFLGGGEYGNAFKVSFRDNDGEKIFHDKVIKVYKNEETQNKLIKYIIEQQVEYCRSTTFDEYWDAISKQVKAAMESFDVELLPEMLNVHKDMIKEQFDKAKNGGVDELLDEWNKNNICRKDIHGCFAEANRALFIKDKIGDLRETNYIEPYYFDFKNGFAIMEMSDDELPEIKKEINLYERFNLIHGDALLNPKNNVCGRIIDYGGIHLANMQFHPF